MFRRRVNPLRMLLAFAVAVAAPAFAVQRTFVASTGVDTNPCTLTQPCRGFAAAVSAVADPDGGSADDPDGSAGVPAAPAIQHIH